MPRKPTRCRICATEHENLVYVAHEMMFGTREPFEYFVCEHCDCLQITDIPADLSKYYADNYHHFSTPMFSNRPSFKAWLKRLRLLDRLGHSNLLGKLIAKIWGEPGVLTWLRREFLDSAAHILDIGCGFGFHLSWLYEDGFRHLTGLDPYIPRDIVYPNGIRIIKQELAGFSGQFDLILLIHSFEHMPNPMQVFATLPRLLKPHGTVVIKIPVFPSFAWRQYQEHWVQLDAPRHLYLHSLKSMELLAQQAGLAITAVDFDSSGFQLWGSEQNKRGIPLKDSRSYYVNPEKSIFTAEEIANFETQAQKLNAAQDGDQASFYLKKATAEPQPEN